MTSADWTDYLQKLFSVGLGIVGTWITVHTFYAKRNKEIMDRYASSQTKEYAAQRDFDHLKNNQEQMKEALKILDDELTETRADFKELKGMLMVFFGKSEQSISGIFGHRKEKE